ncbi:acetyltransferase, ribosomal protein N-acetylase [Aurantiacibacter atlanticus]|uniref:Acetyltransferase, ribosomal protein N-acetylase n=1 Tax=Aurantiacibacter atlanticus TaxID=1648404 RepID=A0A0H4VJL2_9SPHN|nr:GNAT family N-acetyltransferase [Aurantiacibacter atlanticus]AKQ43081.2 acetyltransferase, ribosomal protein N-acetylase [Aurantiacibacter atlanticus]MDF1833411.1 GNAT family N-acetyltransferase [Alteraurantiacibacter sp. bin_em_oilr2.035]
MTFAPMIVTERLELWLPRAADLRPLFDIISQPETMRFLGPSATIEDHFMRFCRNAGCWQLYGYGMFILRERGAQGGKSPIIGNCGIFHSIRGIGEDFDDRAEAAWIIGAGFTGQGYAGEAMRAVLDWFDAEHRAEVMCMIAPGNAASLRLADRLGFASLHDSRLPDGDEVRLFRRPPPSG